jgi:hypothetical protein
MAGALTISTLNNDTGVLATQNGMTGIAKAWVYYNGSTQTINSSFNISSVTRSSTGVFILNFSTAMPTANYSICATGGSTTGYLARSGDDRTARTASAATVVCFDLAGNDQNPTLLGVAIFSS